MNKRTLVILGHPDPGSFCGAIADAYEAGAKAGGHQTERLDLGCLRFDPTLHKGYAHILGDGFFVDIKRCFVFVR